jgi:hypothetical protein
MAGVLNPLGQCLDCLRTGSPGHPPLDLNAGHVLPGVVAERAPTLALVQLLDLDVRRIKIVIDPVDQGGRFLARQVLLC